VSEATYASAAFPAGGGGFEKLRFSRLEALIVAIVLAACGALGSLLGARALASSEAEHSRLAFHLASAGVASSLKLAILHEEDLIVSASAFMQANPSASPAQFDRWADSVGAMARYPELQNIGFVELVPASRLHAFAARVAANPLRPFGPTSSAPRGPFEVFPPGSRPAYCFAIAGLARGRATFLPQSLDYCALAPTLHSARDTAEASYAPFLLGRSRMLGVETPLYRGGIVPATVAARRRAFLGWLGVLVSPEEVIARALEGHPNLALRLTYDRGGLAASFENGSIPSHPETATIDLHNGWTVQSLTAPPPGGVIGNWHARLLLAGGTLVSALIGLLVFTLSSGRRRALDLVREKTRELQHQALHDPLTGLANRALLLDNAERLLARARRTPGLAAAALFVDVDGFKEINDTLGHAAGDELLQIYAARLRATIRGADTAGRLGGDEFVVLAETDAGSPPDALAERLVAMLRLPIELDEGRKLVYVTASVGVAVGQFERPSELLRLADLALYEAKAEGKDGFVVFDAAVQRDLRALAEKAARKEQRSPERPATSAKPVAEMS